MTKIKITGGVKIGHLHASWPLATLEVQRDELYINASVLGNLKFRPADVIAIEPYTMIPMLAQGIRIHHKVPEYNKNIIFRSFRNPEILLSQIRQTGFMDSIHVADPTLEHKITSFQRHGGFPLKKGFAIGVIVLWNLLFLADIISFFLSNMEGSPVGYGMMSAIGVIILCAALLLTSENFRKLAAKTGRKVQDYNVFLYFIIFVCTFMLFSLLVF